MAISRYNRAPVINFGNSYGTSYLIPIIRENIKNGNIQTRDVVLSQGERLDILSAKYFGDAGYDYILAICSNIGYSLQVPPGTIIKIPTKLEDVLKLIS